MPSDDATTEDGHTGPGADEQWSGSVLPLEDMAIRALEYRRSNLRVVFTNGCFDLLHRGHVHYLREARSLGDILIVGLNSDASVARLKGASRPVMKVADRAAVLTALRTVDYVVIFDDPTAERLVAAIQPNVYVKGGDYRAKYPPEAEIAERYGGEFYVASQVEGISTTKVIARIQDAG